MRRLFFAIAQLIWRVDLTSQPGRIRLGMIVALGLGLLAAPAPGQESRARELNFGLIDAEETNNNLVVERDKTFAWMDTLGLPDIKHAPFVKVQIGSAENESGHLAPVSKYGFLLEDRGATFKVLDLDLAVLSLERTDPDTPRTLRVDSDPLELHKFVQGDPLSRLGYDSNQVRIRGNEGHVAVAAEIRYLFLAWACNKRGLSEGSAKLFTRAHAARSDMLRSHYFDPRFGRSVVVSDGDSSDKSIEKLPLKERAAEHLAAAETARAFFALRNPQVSRAQILEQFERIVRLFPGCRGHAKACDLVVQLGMMVEEDRQHTMPSKRRPEGKLSEREQIAELVFRLRDQTSTADEMSVTDIFADPKSPASQLVARGYAAVPLLLEHLDDRRLTRAPEKFFLTDPLLTVGDCAEKILAQISGLGFEPNELGRYNRDFLRRGSYGQLLSAEARIPERLPRIVFSAWHKELKSKGEKRLLIEAASAGNHDSLELGRRLLQRFPEDALPALVRAARGGDQELRQLFVELIRQLPSQAATAFLLEEVRQGPFSSQIVAAEALQERDRPEGLDAMLAEWRDDNSRLFADSEEVRGSKRNIYRVIGFLMGSGRPEAIAGLGKDLRQRPINVRVEAISSLRWVEFTDDRFAAALEKLLIDCLDDFEERRGWNFHSDNTMMTDPRVCDVAGSILNDVMPEKYWFELGALSIKRNRQLVEMKNVWRRANKLPPLPLAEPRDFARVPDRAVRPHLDKFLADPKQRSEAQAEIEKLGIGAFWAVLDFRDTLEKKEDFDLMDGLARKVASTVTLVQFAPASLSPPDALRERFAALTNKPFDSKAYLAAIEAAAKSLPQDVHGVEFTAERYGDGTGFIITIDLLSRQRATFKALPSYREVLPGGGVVVFGSGEADEPARPASAKPGAKGEEEKKKLAFSTRVRIGAGRNRPAEFGASQSLSHAGNGELLLSGAWAASSLQTAVDEALNLEPGESIDVNVRFTRQWHPPSGGASGRTRW